MPVSLCAGGPMVTKDSGSIFHPKRNAPAPSVYQEPAALVGVSMHKAPVQNGLALSVARTRRGG